MKFIIARGIDLEFKILQYYFHNEKRMVSRQNIRKNNLRKMNEKKVFAPKEFRASCSLSRFSYSTCQNQPSRLFVGCLINTLLLLVREPRFFPRLVILFILAILLFQQSRMAEREYLCFVFAICRSILLERKDIAMRFSSLHFPSTSI